MKDLARIAKVPDVRSAVLGDQAGGFFDAVGEPEGEAVAAVMGYFASSMGAAGEALGLGAIDRISLVGKARAVVIFVQGKTVLAANVEPASSLSAAEKALESSIQGA